MAYQKVKSYGYGQLTGMSAPTLLSTINVSRLVADPRTPSVSATDNEVQTLNFNDIGAADTFTLTHAGTATGAITYSADMSTDIDTALSALATIDNVTVSKTSLSVYVVTFTGGSGNTDVSALTITNQTGFTATGVTETTKGGTVGIPPGAQFALIQATTQNVRWRSDGVWPTTTVGMQLAAGGTMLFDGDLDTFTVIEETSGAILNVEFYG